LREGIIVVVSGHHFRDERRWTIDTLDTLAADHDGGYLRAWWVTVIAGAALGAFNSMSNVFGSAYGPFTTTPGQGVLWLEYVSAWLGSAWAWSMFAFTVGWLTRRLGRAVFRAVLGLLVAVVSYYFCDRALGMTGAVEVSLVVYWSLIALVVAPLMALLGVFARKANRRSLLAGLAAPALISYDTLVSPTGPDHIRPWSQWLVLCVAVGLALAFVGRAGRLDRRRPALLESPSGRV
jgi:Family of unknown function (DUF6518)